MAHSISSSSSVCKINRMIDKSTMGHSGKYVIAEYNDQEGKSDEGRIVRARSMKGVLQVRLIGTNTWVKPTNIFER